MNEDLPRVSLGLPVFNGEKYIEQTLDSITAQTFSDFELIICDNSSTDGTQEICQTYASQDDRIRYFRNETNLGAAPNYNRAFELAKGEYFKWVAHDDLITPEYLSRCVEVLDRDPDVVLCYAKATLIDEDSKFIGEYEPKADASVPRPQERFRNLVLTNHKWIQVFGLIRADVVRATRRIDSYPGSDTVFVAELSLRGRFYEIPDRLFSSRIHSKQSVRGSLTVERDRVLWFDTSLEGKIVLPKWQYLWGYLRAIHEAPLTVCERMSCYSHMIRWTLMPPHYRALGKDLILATKSLLKRARHDHIVAVRRETG